MATTTTTPTTADRAAQSKAVTKRPQEAAPAARTVMPRVDIYETEKGYVLLADMPGVPPDGADVECERETLIIYGHVEPPQTPPDYREFELADYRRAFTLSDDLDTGGITAKLKDGVLRLEIPKSPDRQPKKIPVRAE